MSSYLLIGGSGYIGWNLAARLRQRHPAARIVVADFRAIPASTISSADEFLICDVRKNIEAQIGRAAYDCIYNLAAVHREPGHAPKEYYDTNIAGAANVCEYAGLVGCHRIFFSSSIAVYGPTEHGMREPDSKYPITPYGISKFIAEGIHEKWQLSGPGRFLRIFRPGVVYGPGDPGNMLRMIRAVKRGYFAFPGDPHTKKSFAYIEGLLDSLEFADALPDPVFIFNYVEKETLEIAQLVAAVSTFLDRRVPVIRIPLFLLLPLAHTIQWLTRGKSPIHPVRVKKAGNPTWVIPQALIDRSFNFKYDFEASLRDWQGRSPEDFE